MEPTNVHCTKVTGVPWEEMSASEQLDWLPSRGEMLSQDERLPLVVDADFDVEEYLELPDADARLPSESSGLRVHGSHVYWTQRVSCCLPHISAKQQLHVLFQRSERYTNDLISPFHECQLVCVQLSRSNGISMLDAFTKSIWVSKKMYDANSNGRLSHDTAAVPGANDLMNVVGRGSMLMQLWGRLFDVEVRVAKRVPSGIVIGSEFRTTTASHYSLTLTTVDSFNRCATGSKCTLDASTMQNFFLLRLPRYLLACA